MFVVTSELSIDEAKAALVNILSDEIAHGLFCKRNSEKGVFLISKARAAFVTKNNEGNCEIENIDLNLVNSVEFHLGEKEGRLDLLFSEKTINFFYGLRNISKFQKNVEEIFDEILSARKLKEIETEYLAFKPPVEEISENLNKTAHVINTNAELKTPEPKPASKISKTTIIIAIIVGTLVSALMVNLFFKNEFTMLININTITKTKTEMDDMSKSLSRFYGENKMYPENIFANPYYLKKFVSVSTISSGTPITGEDPWNNTYRIYPLPGKTGFTLSSDGPDNLPRTEDDIMQDYLLEN